MYDMQITDERLVTDYQLQTTNKMNYCVLSTTKILWDKNLH